MALSSNETELLVGGLSGHEAPSALLQLDLNSLAHILSFVSARELCALACTCKYLKELSSQPTAWRPALNAPELEHVCCSALSREVAMCMDPGSSMEQLRWTAHAAYSLAHLQYGKFDKQMRVPMPRPCEREGHAAAPWQYRGADALILFGGWGRGIRNDLFILVRDGEGYHWTTPHVNGRKPSIRYGHSVTRCGEQGELLVVYGGMQAGGYSAEIDSLAVLRPVEKDGSGVGAMQQQQQQCSSGGAVVAGSSSAQEAKTTPAEPEYEYEWHHPRLSGDPPVARGYHSACASEDGTKLYLLGGISDHDSILDLVCIDLKTWVVEKITGTGEEVPGVRFGNSLVAYRGKLWVVGGGVGSDLARSGWDLDDVWCLDLATRAWSRVTTANDPPHKRFLGRCHASCLVGSKLVLFGGSLELSNSIIWLDMDSLTWGQPTVIGAPPGKRMSTVMVPLGVDLVLFGGWIYSQGEMGDLYRFKMVLEGEELQAAKDKAAGRASAAAGSEASGSGVAHEALGQQKVSERLSDQIAKYYSLTRQAQDMADADGAVPLGLIREMHECMMVIRVLRAQSERRDALVGSWLGMAGDDDDDGDDEDGGLAGFLAGYEALAYAGGGDAAMAALTALGEDGDEEDDDEEEDGEGGEDDDDEDDEDEDDEDDEDDDDDDGEDLDADGDFGMGEVEEGEADADDPDWEDKEEMKN